MWQIRTVILGAKDCMTDDEVILEPILRRCAESALKYWHKLLGDAEYKRVVCTTDPQHIYTYSGWPLKVELFKDKKNLAAKDLFEGGL